MRILVTGAAGFMGSHLATVPLEEGIKRMVDWKKKAHKNLSI